MSSEYWKGKNIFVTGAAGFLGGHLCEELVELGANVIGLVRDEVPNAYFIQHEVASKITVVHGDLNDQFLIERVLNEYEIDICFHLGAQPLVEVANRSPRSTYESNIRGTWNLLEAARMSPLLKGTVVASSDKAYGESDQLPYDETLPLSGKNPYDLSKTCTDMIAQSYAQIYDMPILISRCGNFFGPGDLYWSRIIPGLCRWLSRGERPIIRSDGTPIRDYFFVKDVVSGYVTLGEHVEDAKLKGEAFNFGTGQPISVLDLVTMMQKIAGREDLNPDIQGTASNEISAQYLSCKKVEKLFHWKPQYTLEEALKITYKWYVDFLS